MEADNLLSAALKSNALRAGPSTPDWPWLHDWLICDLHRREAEALIRHTSGKPANPPTAGATP